MKIQLKLIFHSGCQEISSECYLFSVNICIVQHLIKGSGIPDTQADMFGKLKSGAQNI